MYMIEKKRRKREGKKKGRKEEKREGEERRVCIDIPLSGTATTSGSGKVTNGKVTGFAVTILSNSILFMALVKSRPISSVSESV